MAEEPQAPSSARLGAEAGEYDDGLSAFAGVRPRLFGIAYRMLGSAAEAEDVVQDVWLRWQSTNRGAVENPPAYLATTTTRLCINLAQSAHTRRETYIGTWLPEPVDTSSDPRIGAERSEALKLAVLMLLEKLSPTERAPYVLREAFDYSYRQIADILQMEEANVRQLVSRARKHIADGRRTSVSSGEQRRLLEAFIAGAAGGAMWVVHCDLSECLAATQQFAIDLADFLQDFADLTVMGQIFGDLSVILLGHIIHLRPSAGIAHGEVVLGAMTGTVGAFASRLAAGFVALDERATKQTLERRQLAQQLLPPPSQSERGLFA